MYNQIPEELKIIPQWVCWKYEKRNGSKLTKVPYNPVTGFPASVTDLTSWTTFNIALQNIKKYNGIGFVFTKHDVYACIDLDECDSKETLKIQKEIFEKFDSYSERSPSGKGLHIIIKGEIPTGKRKGKIEIYSSERYMTMTGNVFRNSHIKNHNKNLNILWERIGGEISISNKIPNVKEIKTDDEILKIASEASNSVKFNSLFKGQWENLGYPSQSEADFALINILQFYTKSPAQISRIFRKSGLMREKAKRQKYLDYMINKAFDNEPPKINLDVINESINSILKNFKNKDILKKTPPLPPKKTEFDLRPPGLMGEIMDYIYESAQRPVREIALAGAIGLMCGICGRAYNVSASGLNLYVILVANTGIGKETMASGIGKLMSAIKYQVPAAVDFIGPAEFASGQALLKHITKNPCFVSIGGEYGIRMKELSNPKINDAKFTLKRVMLDLFNKSGKFSTLQASVYSNKDNNTDSINSPAFSILGETTPETLYENLDESLIADGLLPRFTIIEYTGKRPRSNHNHMNITPNQDLINKLVALVTSAHQIIENNTNPIETKMTEQASKYMDDFDIFVDSKINNASRDVVRHLWNRAHLKALRLSALVAVGKNPFNPIIDMECAKWAIHMISKDAISFVKKFENGEIGKTPDETLQLELLIETIISYIKEDWKTIAKDANSKLLHENSIIPWSFLTKRLGRRSCFKNDKLGTIASLKRTVNALIDNGDILEVSKIDLISKYNFSGKGYTLKNLTLLKR